MAQILLDIYTAVQECLLFRRFSLHICVCFCVFAHLVPDIERRYTSVSSIESEAWRFIREKPRSRRRETINKSQSPQRRSKEQPIIRVCHPDRIYEIWNAYIALKHYIIPSIIYLKWYLVQNEKQQFFYRKI